MLFNAETFAQKLLALGKQQTGLDPPSPQSNHYSRFQRSFNNSAMCNI